MAISMNYPSPFGGADFTYFIVGEIAENRYFNKALVTLYGFIDQSARQAMASYLPVTVALDEAVWVRDATIEQVYDLVKATPEFASATDA